MCNYNLIISYRAKKYSENLSISPYPSTAQNTLRLKSYIKDPDHLSSDMYIIKPINEINHANDIFATTYQWKREKPKYKPKEYTFRVNTLTYYLSFSLKKRE